MVFLLALAVLLAAEVVALVEVARQIGVLAAVLLLLATSIAGPLLVKRAGFGVWRRARARLDEGQIPGREALDGLLLLTAGLLICIPGFITDAAGVLLL
nr:FxsA family protein [Actinomycetota bacterium]